jgi:hypothetical protein
LLKPSARFGQAIAYYGKLARVAPIPGGIVLIASVLFFHGGWIVFAFALLSWNLPSGGEAGSRWSNQP